jgi:hypothetical protein
LQYLLSHGASIDNIDRSIEMWFRIDELGLIVEVSCMNLRQNYVMHLRCVITGTRIVCKMSFRILSMESLGVMQDDERYVQMMSI